MTNSLAPHEAAKINKYATASRRLMISVIAGLVAGALVAFGGDWKLVPLTAWDVAALTYVFWVWRTIWPMGAAQTKALAVREDPSRTVTDVVLTTASLVSLVAVGLLVVQSASSTGFTKGLQVGIGVISVVLSWVLVHTISTLKYARLYYSEPEGGIDFNESDDPQYTDFAYLAITLGMTFQVSDTDIKTKAIRKSALQHAILSYVFGTIIIATTINFLAGLGK